MDRQAVARVCAWGAKVDKNDVVLCRGAVAGSNDNGAWFYSDGDSQTTEPVETVLLKRLRDSEQEAEYLALASRTAEAPMAHAVANLLVRPMLGAELILPTNFLVARWNLLHLRKEKNFWRASLKAAVFPQVNRRDGICRSFAGFPSTVGPRCWLALHAVGVWDDARSRSNSSLKLGIDIYTNPSGIPPTGNTLQWSALPLGLASDRIECHSSSTIGIASHTQSFQVHSMPHNFILRHRGRSRLNVH